jgi:hypothetical protein
VIIFEREKYMSEQNQNGETRAQKLGRTVGSLFAYVVAGCMCAIVLAITIKLVGWILF